MKTIIVTLLLLTAAGCASQPPTHHVTNGPKVKDELMVLTPEQDRALRPDVSAAQSTGTQADVLEGPDVIAYPIAGRVDPNHPDVAYYGTWAVRRTAPKWKLQPAPPKEIMFGVQRNEARQELKPVQKQEVETLLLEQRTLNDENRQAITRLIRVQRDQQKQIAEIHQAVMAKEKTEKTNPPSSDAPVDAPADAVSPSKTPASTPTP